jgi:predicted transposase YdaD
MTREQQHEYIRSIMAEIDVRSQVRTAEEKAEAKGKAELVKAMRDKGLPISTIAEISGFSEAQIMAL